MFETFLFSVCKLKFGVEYQQSNICSKVYNKKNFIEKLVADVRLNSNFC